MEEMLQFISNNGFAIFVAVYMLVYQNKSMTTLTEAVKDLTTWVKAMHGVEHE